MKILVNFLLLQIFSNCLTLITDQWCFSYKSVVKSRIQLNNGQRLVSKRNFFGGIIYNYKPYVYSTVQSYHDYERIKSCCDGYTQISDTECEPLCIPSCPSNTHCIRPDICECNTGFIGYTANALNIQCKPDCWPTCSENAQCIAPNNCVCNSGYEDTNGDGICQPICQEICPENSSCSQPNECSCNTGYSADESGQCKPVCYQQCPTFSECSHPNICNCQANYKMNEGICVPICEQECPKHAQCKRPKKCECVEGYEAITILNSTSFTCDAKCDKDCPAFSKCTKPNVCECQQGYRNTESNFCEPICDIKCPLYSTCSEPNLCTCDKGYTMLDQQCLPICEKSCPENSNCTEPNKCQCETGYQMKLSSIYNLFCEPVCQTNCSSFGKCVQPNKCMCLEGYEMDEMEVCQPVCHGKCKNGFCFQPNVCICNPGYLMGPQEECEPVCSMTCQNGSCVEPEMCQCHEGFTFKNSSINVCEPVCEPPCINGICVAPNVCICHENYEPVAFEQDQNHSNCQLILTTTIAKETDLDEITTTTTALNEVEDIDFVIRILDEEARTIFNFDATSSRPAQLRQTTPNSVVSADVCNQKCQCWWEIDEFGPLAKQQCIHICVDGSDKPCLDLKLCQCDSVKNQLSCRTSDDNPEIDEPLFYICNLPRLMGTTSKPVVEGITSDMKTLQPLEESTFPWWCLVAVGGLVVICASGTVLYLRFRKVEDTIIEYEL